MRYIGVSGSRSFSKYKLLRPVLDALRSRYGYITIVTGGAAGADTLAAWWAQQNGVNCIIYEPDWSLGKLMGFARDQKIADRCDELVACFTAGKPCNGTKHTVELVEAQDKPVTYIGYTPREKTDDTID